MPITIYKLCFPSLEGGQGIFKCANVSWSGIGRETLHSCPVFSHYRTLIFPKAPSAFGILVQSCLILRTQNLWSYFWYHLFYLEGQNLFWFLAFWNVKQHLLNWHFFQWFFFFNQHFWVLFSFKKKFKKASPSPFTN